MNQSSITRNDAFYPSPFGIKYAPYQENPTIASIINAPWVESGPLAEVPGMESTTKMDRPKSSTFKFDQQVSDRSGKVTFSLQQIDPSDLKTLLCGLLKLELITGTAITGYNQNYAVSKLSKGTFIPFDNQNYAGGALIAPSAVTVKNDYAGTPTTLVENTDYEIVKINGKWGILLTIAGAFDSAETTQITYSYTPVAKSRLYKTEITEVGNIMLMAYKKVPSKISGNKYIEIYYPMCSPTKDFAIKGQSWDSVDYNNVALEYEANMHENFLYEDQKVLEFSEFYVI
jgi:hypothetical protein